MSIPSGKHRRSAAARSGSSL
uniref:NADP-dependent oxidoreductase, putative n=1 Tax=Arundo donax TaxID=35708 RepID=A0A0A9GPS9_ARUDO